MQKYKVIREKDKKYPIYLRNIYRPPSSLYYYGNLTDIDFSRAISIVGSRRATDYGYECVEKIIGNLKGTESVVISGLAMGIDSMVHRECLKNNIRSIAVMPLGINNITPIINRDLYYSILRNGGVIIAEDEFVASFYKYFYIRRNRIIAGLSLKTIVIEAGLNSGAVNTARHAFNENRCVYAIPGRVDMEYSMGTNKIIKDNIAILLNDFDEIIY
jgi:DNA processing protein